MFLNFTQPVNPSIDPLTLLYEETFRFSPVWIRSFFSLRYAAIRRYSCPTGFDRSLGGARQAIGDSRSGNPGPDRSGEKVGIRQIYAGGQLSLRKEEPFLPMGKNQGKSGFAGDRAADTFTVGLFAEQTQPERRIASGKEVDIGSLQPDCRYVGNGALARYPTL